MLWSCPRPWWSQLSCHEHIYPQMPCFVHSCSEGLHLAKIFHFKHDPKICIQTSVPPAYASHLLRWKTNKLNVDLPTFSCELAVVWTWIMNRVFLHMSHTLFQKATVSKWLHLSDKQLTQTVRLLRNTVLYTAENTVTDKITHLSAARVSITKLKDVFCVITMIH